MKFDVVIVSKDRYPLLLKQVKRIKNRFPYNKIIVVDSTAPPFRLNIDEDVEYYHTPNVKLGYARNIGVKAVSTPFFFMIDDDINFKKGIAKKLYNALIKYGAGVFAISPIILFGTNENLLAVYRRMRQDRYGASNGFVIMNKQKLNLIGGYNTRVHIGEDTELATRGKSLGQRWIRKHNLFVHHPGTDVDFIFRTWRHRDGQMISVAYGFDTYQSLIFRKISEMFINILSSIKYRNFNTLMNFMAKDTVTIFTIIRRIIGGKRYVLSKGKTV